jgi:Holliday junction resolvasome RuvABC endonuclease subunit
MFVILGLDLGTRTGWARAEFAFGKIVTLQAGTERFDLGREESRGMRFLRFRAWLDVMLAGEKMLRPDVVAYELPHHRGGAATRVLLGMVGILQETCERHKIDYQELHTASLKKRATGRGNAEKPAMIAAAQLAWPDLADQIDEHSADALWALTIAADESIGQNSALTLSIEIPIPDSTGGKDSG